MYLKILKKYVGFVFLGITWTWPHVRSWVLGYSFSSGCKRSSRHGTLRQAGIIPYVILPRAWQGRALRDNQRRR